MTARTLVIPDLHMRLGEADAIFAALAGRYDHVVLLGDYFDRPPTARGVPVSREEADAVVDWLRRSLEQPNRVHLAGNHDLCYFMNRNEARCSGTTPAMRAAIDQGIGPDHLPQFCAAVVVGPWLVSHAGFAQKHVRGRSARTLAAMANSALAAAPDTATEFFPLLGCGIMRGGSLDRSGVTWCDWDYEFWPSVGVHQIVGHTYEQGLVRGKSCRRGTALPKVESFELGSGEEVLRSSRENDSCNWCIDTGLEVVAILDEEAIRFVRWLAE